MPEIAEERVLNTLGVSVVWGHWRVEHGKGSGNVLKAGIGMSEFLRADTARTY